MRLGTFYRAQILKHFNIQAVGNNVLDVGGFDGFWLSTQKAENKYVLDLEIKNIYKNIKYIKASALSIPFVDNFFDQVFAFDVLEHIEEGKEQIFIDELIRVCKKDGEIVLTTPSSKIKLFPSFLTNFISKKWGHNKCNGYSKNEIKEMLFKHENIRYQIIENNTPFFRHFFILIRIIWKIFFLASKKIIKKICQYDYRYRKGNKGFYLILIRKKYEL